MSEAVTGVCVTSSGQTQHVTSAGHQTLNINLYNDHEHQAFILYPHTDTFKLRSPTSPSISVCQKCLGAGLRPRPYFTSSLSKVKKVSASPRSPSATTLPALTLVLIPTSNLLFFILQMEI